MKLATAAFSLFTAVISVDVSVDTKEALETDENWNPWAGQKLPTDVDPPEPLSDKPPVFVINLEGSKGRLNEMTRNVGVKKHLFGRSCRVDAVDFRNCTGKFHFVKAPWWERGKEGGLLASGMSHRRIWAMVVKKKIPVAIVMEDDVKKFSWDFDQIFTDVMNRPADFDVFRFSTMYFAPRWINETKRQLHNECHFMTVYKHLAARSITHMPHYSFGAALYAISYEGAVKGLTMFNPLDDIIDSFAWAEKVKCMLPAVATADGGNGHSTRKDIVYPNSIFKNHHYKYSSTNLSV